MQSVCVVHAWPVDCDTQLPLLAQQGDVAGEHFCASSAHIGGGVDKS